jgi:3-deoxy-D-manno-octulosonic-acid transferase
MNILYDIAFVFFLFFYAPVFFFKKRKRHGIGLRLGFYPKELINKLSGRKNIWIHAVSVGEVIAVSPLVKAMREKYPAHRIVFTTVTETGNTAAQKILSNNDIALYLPFDLGFIVGRVISFIRPCLLVITETELWPNLIMRPSEYRIKVFLVNGRISDSSFKKYKIVKPLLSSIIKKIHLACMQTTSDKNRILRLGAVNRKTVVLGNMKFDSALLNICSGHERQHLQEVLNLNGQLIVAGSTHKGEEEIILEIYKKLKIKFPGIVLVIAPRHIERAIEIAHIADREGLKSLYFSKIMTANYPAKAAPTAYPDSVIILDVIGMLKNLYSLAEIVFIGGSLVKKGGQNIIEPAVFSKPVIIGPYTHNFRDIVEMFLREEAVIIVKSKAMLLNKLDLLLKDETLCSRLGRKARLVVETNKGIAEQTLSLIENENVFL